MITNYELKKTFCKLHLRLNTFFFFFVAMYMVLNKLKKINLNSPKNSCTPCVPMFCISCAYTAGQEPFKLILFPSYSFIISEIEIWSEKMQVIPCPQIIQINSTKRKLHVNYPPFVKYFSKQYYNTTNMYWFLNQCFATKIDPHPLVNIYESYPDIKCFNLIAF